MSSLRSLWRGSWLLIALASGTLTTAAFAATHNGSQASGGSACGEAATATVASVDTKVARRIYNGELRSSEVSADLAHVRADSQLVQALATGDLAEVQAQVAAIVYTPHWHIVRLRVVKAGKVLADVGGPDVIAPVQGQLRLGGHEVGSFEMSVQDDLGYVKLVSRFLDVPIDLYREGALVMGTLLPAPAPASLSPSRPLFATGQSYRPYLARALAFPSGSLRVALFVPSVSAQLERESCTAVRDAAWGQVATNIAARFVPLAAHYPEFAGTLEGSSAGLVSVREGPYRLAGDLGPRRLPRSGTVRYHGKRWLVFSWEPSPPARVYLLTPAPVSPR